MTLGYAVLAVLWLALIAYAVLGGADFGAGIWDFLSYGSRGQRQRELITKAIGPVWEANHVWLIFLIVGLFTAFPLVFAELSTALFIPFTIALLGIVLRGAAFIFRTYASETRFFSLIWSRVFGLASAITPFMLGASAAAVASGRITVVNGVTTTDLGFAWLSLFALTIGAMAVALCATLAAIYLTVEAVNSKDQELEKLFRVRALSAGAVTAGLGAVGLALAPSEAAGLWNGMFNHAVPVVIATMLVGLGVAAALWWRHYRLARALIVLETAFLLGSWGISQLPYLIPPDRTVANSVVADVMLAYLLGATAIGMILLLPSLWFLFRVFKSEPRSSI